MRIAPIIAALALTGCANIDYLNDNYGNAPQVSFKHADHYYEVFDKPAEKRLVISTAVGAAIGAGAIRGLTFGLINNHPSEPVMHQAVDAYLKSTGRICEPGTGQLIADPEWEFHYSCTAVSAAAN